MKIKDSYIAATTGLILTTVWGGAFVLYIIISSLITSCNDSKAMNPPPGDNSFVTELYLANNFTPKTGITPGSNNTLFMDCDQILARYNVSISGATSTGHRLPSQNQISNSKITLTYQGIYNYNGATYTLVSYPTFLDWPIVPRLDDVYIKFSISNNWNSGKAIFFKYSMLISTYITEKNVAAYRIYHVIPDNFPVVDDDGTHLVDYGNVYVAHDNDFSDDKIKNTIGSFPTITYNEEEDITNGFSDDATEIYLNVRPHGAWANLTEHPKLVYFSFQDNTVIDFTGTTTIGIACDIIEDSSYILCWPNPVLETEKVYFYGVENVSTVKMYNSGGFLVRQWSVSPSSFEYVQLDAGLSWGYYAFRLHDSDDVLLHTFSGIIVTE